MEKIESWRMRMTLAGLLLVPGGVLAEFTEIPASESGVKFQNSIPLELIHERANINPSGLAAGDIDGDGLVDLYFCNAGGANRLYRNLGGFKFEDVTDSLGKHCRCEGEISIGSAMADLDGDGDLDLLVTARGTGNRLFLNQGKGELVESVQFPGRNSTSFTTSLAMADVDLDGDLDIYLTNHRNKSLADDPKDPDQLEFMARVREEMTSGKPLSAAVEKVFYRDGAELLERGDADEFYLNEGGGVFKAVGAERFRLTEPGGAPALEGWGLGVQFRDVNGDGAPDLYVCNDFHTPDRFWINDGTGHFTLLPKSSQRKMSWFSMTVDFADIDRDGDFDFFVTDMLSRDHSRRKRQMGDMVSNSPQSDPSGVQPQVMQNTLFLNRGDESFAEISAYAGLRASEWTWGAIFEDADLDGDLDLFVSTGMLHDQMDADLRSKFAAMNLDREAFKKTRSQYPPIKSRNLLFKNDGKLGFKERGIEMGLKRGAVSGGMVFADLDGDLDQDLIIANTGSAPEIYRNDSKADRIAVRLLGDRENTRGIGARVSLEGAGPIQLREPIAGGRLSSGSCSEICFAVPGGEASLSEARLIVRWPDGRVSQLKNLKIQQAHEIKQSEASSGPTENLAKVESLFRVTRLPLIHRENQFDDFALQSLLPNRLSELGPGLIFSDWDGDGFDDLMLGGAAGQPVQVMKYQAELKNDFELVDSGLSNFSAGSDLGGALLTDLPDGKKSLNLSISSWEDAGNAKSLAVLAFDGAKTWSPLALSDRQGDSSPGHLAMADVDLDGDLDWFLAGRVRNSRYPAAATSRIIINGGDATSFDSSVLNQIGLVSAACFADIDADGDQDLLLAREWGSPAILINKEGKKLVDATEQWGLSSHTGWWNGIEVADVNHDGKLDIIATNWGRNSKYEGSYKAGSPLSIYFGDLDQNGSFDIVEAHKEKKGERLVPERGLSCSSRAMPFVKRITPSFEAFGEAKLDEIYGDRLKNAGKVIAEELRHMVFVQKDKGFEAIPLPPEAQFAPAFGIGCADFNGDGHPDIVLAQNFHAVQIETPRNDGGQGLLLLGDGTGNFEAVSGDKSGIQLNGEFRSLAVADYNHDGRPDFACAENDGALRVFKNRSGRAGVRVKLVGKGSNRMGIGAKIRAISKGKTSSQIISCGSGYWSQHSACRVLTATEPITAVEVIWPDGTRSEIPIKQGETRVIISQSGQGP